MLFATPSSNSEEEVTLTTTCFYCREPYQINHIRNIVLEIPEECPLCYQEHRYVVTFPNCVHKCCRGCMTEIYNHLNRPRIERNAERERERNEAERRRIQREERIARITTQFETLTIEQRVQEIYRGMASIEPTVVPWEEMIAHRLVLKNIMESITIQEIAQTDSFWWLNNDEHDHPLSGNVIDHFAFQWEETRCIWKRSSSDPFDRLYSRHDKWYLICFDNGNFHYGRRNLVPPPPYIDFHARIKFIPSSRKWIAYVTEPVILDGFESIS